MTPELDDTSREQLGTALERLGELLRTTRRRRTPVEAPAQLTGAYATFLLAHGFARIGQHERARAFVGEARDALATVISDPVHAYLATAFEVRIEQAIAGQPPDSPLPEAFGAQLMALARPARFKVDRLREASRILEPVEHVDSLGAFSRKQSDERGPEFAALRMIADPAARAEAVARLIEAATRAGEDDRIRLLSGCLDVVHELPESHAIPLLVAAIPVIEQKPGPRRAVLYARALGVIGHFGWAELLPRLLGPLAGEVGFVPEHELPRVIDQSLYALRRLGLRDEMSELLATFDHALATGAPPHLATEDQRRDYEHQRRLSRLALAGGIAFLGDTARALPILDQACKALGEPMTPPHRLERIRALALAYAQAPLGHALGGIAELSGYLRDITDSFGTNSHFCLAVLHFVESLVTGIASAGASARTNA